MIKLVLVRHGESIWNLENKFTGWTDVDLSENGIKEAKEAGIVLRENNYSFDIAYTSVLKRAENTLKYILEEMNLSIPIYKTWKLNERHYGALQGLNKEETAKKYGAEQVKMWRRSVDAIPPAITKEDQRYPGNDIKYKDLKEEELPLTENLNETINRVIDYYKNNIENKIKENKKVLIVAHGNSLRGLIKYLKKLSDEQTMELEIETGNPICLELDKNLNVINDYYLKKK